MHRLKRKLFQVEFIYCTRLFCLQLISNYNICQTSPCHFSSVSYTVQKKNENLLHLVLLKSQGPRSSHHQPQLEKKERQTKEENRGICVGKLTGTMNHILSHQFPLRRVSLFTEMRPFASLSAGLISELVPR